MRVQFQHPSRLEPLSIMIQLLFLSLLCGHAIADGVSAKYQLELKKLADKAEVGTDVRLEVRAATKCQQNASRIFFVIYFALPDSRWRYASENLVWRCELTQLFSVAT